MDKIDILSGYCKESGCGFKLNEALAGYTSFKIGKTADIVVLPNTERQLFEIMRIVKECELGYILLGNGSNVLLCEKNFGGAVIITSNMSDIKIESESVYAGCGTSLNKIASAAKAHCLSGLEFAYGIPGSLGGAVHMNAGAYGGQMSDVVFSSRCLDTDSLEIKDLSAAQHEFAYRESIYSKNNSLIAMSAVLNLKYGDQSKIESEMEKNMAARREKQPLEYPSAGSVFKRIDGQYAAKLIDDCGLKGRCVGGAMVSKKHAGFIINAQNASFSDVTELIACIKSEVFDKTGINLECEIKIIEW